MPGDRKHHSEKMRSCVDKLLADGKEESSAFAICTASLQKAGEPIFEGAESRSAEEMKLLSSQPRALHLRGATAAVRTEMIEGREHLIVPVVALMEGVIHASNSDVPEFVSAELLTRVHRAWEGHPCVVGHPNKNGRQCSAYEDGMLEGHGFGTIRLPHMNGKRFGLEAVIDPERLKTLGQLQLLSDLQEGKAVNVSVGAYVVTRPKQGIYNGKSYKAEWVEILPDHLAFLTDKNGACSLAMGCGAHRAAMMHLITAEAIELVIPPCPVATATAAYFKALLSVDDMRDYDIREALNKALRTSVPLFRGVVDVYPESHRVIYMVSDPEDRSSDGGPMMTSPECYRRSYKLADDGNVTLGKDVETVKPTMTYETASDMRIAAIADNATLMGMMKKHGMTTGMMEKAMSMTPKEMADKHGMSEEDAKKMQGMARMSMKSASMSTIRHEGGKWVLYSKSSNAKLGTHDSKAEAEAQEKAIEVAKQRRSLELVKGGNGAATQTAACGCGAK